VAGQVDAGAAECRALLASAREGDILRHGVQVVLAGASAGFLFVNAVA
jgi:tRNA U34 5-carboxymethylaminomethyl modifying GTPase MnmE/TrmE